MATSISADVFRYPDLPSELQLKILEKYFEGTEVRFVEIISECSPDTVVREKEVDGMKLCTYDTVRPVEPYKIVSKVFSEVNIVNLLLVSRDFELQTMQTLNSHEQVYYYTYPENDEITCPPETYVHLYEEKKSRFDPSVYQVRAEIDFIGSLMKRIRFKNLRSIKLMPMLPSDQMSTVNKNFPLQDLHDIYVRKIDTDITRWARSDLEQLLFRAGFRLEDILSEGIGIHLGFISELSLFCGSCDDCPMDFRQMNFDMDIDCFGCRLGDIIDVDDNTYFTRQVYYFEEESELENLVKLYNAKKAGKMDEWEELMKLWEIFETGYETED